MDKDEAIETVGAVRLHLEELRDLVKQRQDEGRFIGAKVFHDLRATNRSTHWLTDQVVFCYSEIEFWERIVGQFF